MEGMCGLGQAPELLSPPVSFSVKCAVVGGGAGRMENAWEALL